MNILLRISIIAIFGIGLSGCLNPPTRMGMVKNPSTGLMYGSIIEKNIVTDPSFYDNKKIKVRIRNTSGDVAFDLHGFKNQIRAILAASGYEPTDDDDFGLLIDINVMYSGQIQSSLTREFAFLGAASGGLAGAAKSRGGGIGTAVGVLAGATLGSIIGSFVTDDTYIVVSRVTFGEIKEKKRSKKYITFSRSPKLRSEYDNREEQIRKTRGFKKAFTTSLSVFAGGRNTVQSDIAEQVRARIARIVGNFI
jgi:hypothetical protein